MNVTRRTFGYALGAGAGYAALASGAETRKIRYCAVGLGRISLGHFMPGCRQAQNAEIVAVVTGHREKGEKAAADYNFSPNNIYSYENYDGIADNKNIDAMYIGLPNSMHAEYTIRAANAGKHVLCEKPMANNVKDSQAMIAACKAANVKLFIAYRCQYVPANLKAIELVKSGRLGKIQAIQSSNGFNIKPGEWRLDKKLAGGGPLADMGVYSLNASRYFTGEEPEHLEAYAFSDPDDPRFKTVEQNLGWTMRFPSGVIASCTTSYGANLAGDIRIYGSKGSMIGQPAFAYQGITYKVNINGEAPFEIAEDEKDPAQFTTEASEFARCILENSEPKTNGEEGLRDMQYMAAIYKSAGIHTL